MDTQEPSPVTVPLVEQPEWSRKLARLVHVPPISDLNLDAHRAFYTDVETATAVAELTPEHQSMISEAEAAQQGGAL